MTIIQNVACIDLICNPSDKKINFDAEILHGKKIKTILVCGINYTGPIYNPPKPLEFMSPALIKSIGLYMNLTDIKGNQFLSDFAGDNFVVDIFDPNFIEYEIDRVLDFTHCFFTYKVTPNITMPAKIRVYVFYQTENFTPFTDEINGTFTAKVKGYQKLINSVGKNLDNKKIKKIISNGAVGKLDLICKNKRIEKLNTFFFENNTPKEFYLDNLEIDYEKSTFSQTGLNINYDQFLTFIY